MSITVLLVDDHGVVREGLRHLLSTQPDMEVVGEAGDGREAIKAVAELCPDVVVMDIAMPEMNGIEATRQICASSDLTRVVILSVYSTAEHVYRAMKAGASGYVLKESIGRELFEAVRAAHAGRRYVSRTPDGQDIERHHQGLAADSPLDRLSDREREVLQYVVEGRTSAAIASLLYLSPKTVETYRCRLMAKLGIKDLPSLVKYAIQQGLTPLK